MTSVGFILGRGNLLLLLLGRPDIGNLPTLTAHLHDRPQVRVDLLRRLGGPVAPPRGLTGQHVHLLLRGLPHHLQPRTGRAFPGLGF